MKESKAQPVMGVGDDWAFDYPLEAVKMAWQIKRLTNRIPSYDEISSLDPRWLSDIALLDDIYNWVNRKNDNLTTGGDNA